MLSGLTCSSSHSVPFHFFPNSLHGIYFIIEPMLPTDGSSCEKLMRRVVQVRSRMER